MILRNVWKGFHALEVICKSEGRHGLITIFGNWKLGVLDGLYGILFVYMHARYSS